MPVSYTWVQFLVQFPDPSFLPKHTLGDGSDGLGKWLPATQCGRLAPCFQPLPVPVLAIAGFRVVSKEMRSFFPPLPLFSTPLADVKNNVRREIRSTCNHMDKSRNTAVS